ncbi:MAG TPA: hypothetical protein ACFYD0_14270 [Candidatus Wunengus sp. YC65]|uniref:hypothetical protein n=1 Tax=Candidatus Wunengus sp. YC65 TaxID=3367701 RepID=UPI004024C5DF
MKHRFSTVAFILLSILVFLNPSPGFCENQETRTTLAAFSLNAAKYALDSGRTDAQEMEELFSIGYINRIWAVLLDDKSDLIIVGERDPSLPLMHLDDIAVALRTIDKISTGENPGVSIEPPSHDEYSPIQKVKYFGGIEKTHYGKICFEADYLLKHLSLGFSLTGIDGFPSEWDMELDNAKAGRELELWESSIGRSWFYPYKIMISHKNKTASLTSITMEVRTDMDNELDLPKGYLEINEETITDILKDNPNAVSVIHARLITQNYDKIASTYPVLIQLQNLLALSGLLAEVLKDEDKTDISYWLKDYSVQESDTPEEIPMLNRGVKGLAYTSLTSGGVLSLYEIKDGWTEAVISRIPKYIKQAALLSRPSPDAITWVIPLELGAPENWSEERLKMAQEIKPIEIAKYKDIDTRLQLGYLSEPLKTPGWHPQTDGNILLAFKGNLYFSTSGIDYRLPNVDFVVSQTQINMGILPSLLLSLYNRLDFEFTVPFIVRIQQFDESPEVRLPGLISNPVYAYAGGLESPIITNRILLLDGISNGRRAYPSLELQNTAYMPTSNKMFNGFLIKPEQPENEKLFEVPFGTKKWNGFHELTIQYPLSYSLIIGASGAYHTEWKGSIDGDRKRYGGFFNHLISKDTGLAWGIEYNQSSINQSDNGWVSEGHQVLLALSVITKSGINSFKIGMWVPGESTPELGTSFMMAIDLSGSTLWDWRRWL